MNELFFGVWPAKILPTDDKASSIKLVSISLGLAKEENDFQFLFVLDQLCAFLVVLLLLAISFNNEDSHIQFIYFDLLVTFFIIHWIDCNFIVKSFVYDTCNSIQVSLLCTKHIILVLKCVSNSCGLLFGHSLLWAFNLDFFVYEVFKDALAHSIFINLLLEFFNSNDFTISVEFNLSHLLFNVCHISIEWNDSFLASTKDHSDASWLLPWLSTWEVTPYK